MLEGMLGSSSSVHHKHLQSQLKILSPLLAASYLCFYSVTVAILRHQALECVCVSQIPGSSVNVYM